MFAIGLFDHPKTGNFSVDARSPEHTLLARQFASESTVLLKNLGGLLPLSFESIQSIGILGDVANSDPIYAGGGSGHVVAPNLVTVLKGIQDKVKGKGIKV